MAWVQFPFPSCPRCNREWETTRHTDCVLGGALDIDPDARRVRCDQCYESWAVSTTTFNCSCGRSFLASEVDSALNEIIRAANLLAMIIEENQREVRSIRSQGQGSFQRWLDGVAQGIGGSMGRMLGNFIGSIAGWLFSD